MAHEQVDKGDNGHAKPGNGKPERAKDKPTDDEDGGERGQACVGNCPVTPRLAIDFGLSRPEPGFVFATWIGNRCCVG
jgi:hypothetical protein